jgi:hypothetical protein
MGPRHSAVGRCAAAVSGVPGGLRARGWRPCGDSDARSAPIRIKRPHQFGERSSGLV